MPALVPRGRRGGRSGLSEIHGAVHTGYPCQYHIKCAMTQDASLGAETKVEPKWLRIAGGCVVDRVPPLFSSRNERREKRESRIEKREERREAREERREKKDERIEKRYEIKEKSE